MIAGILAAPAVLGVYGKYKYDDYKRKPLKEQFALNNVNAAALYFPRTVTYNGRIEIFDINAINPELIQQDTTPNDPNNKINEGYIDNDISQESVTKKHFKSLSEKSMKWFSKIKDEAIQKVDEVKQKIDEKATKTEKKDNNNNNNNDQKQNDDDDDNDDDEKEKKMEEVLEKFSDNIHLEIQLNIPLYLKSYLIDNKTIKSSQDIKSLIQSNIRYKYKWKECQVYIHENCMYLKFDNAEWKYLSFYNNNLQFIPLTIANKNNASYFYWTDSINNYVIGRCATNINIEKEKKEDNDNDDDDNVSNKIISNFINSYIASKTDIISRHLSLTEHYRKLWIMNENMIKSRKDILDIGGNIAAIYHRNEFELDLKLLIRSEIDIRSDYWGKFEDSEFCALDDCNNKFSTFKRKHHCYICGKVICDECGKNKFKNPINCIEQRACNDCFSLFYPKMKDKDNVYNLDLNKLLNEYNNKKENKYEWNEKEINIIKECGILCHWIYEGNEDNKLIEILGFKQLKLVKYGEENQSVQYGIIQSLKYPDIIYLVYRGSHDFMDWIINFQQNPLKLTDIGFRVHSGMYTSLQQHVLDVIINDLCKKMIIPQKKRLIITGHSLGGGYSLLSAIHILSKQKELNNYFNEKNLKIITFGAPLVLEKDINKNTKIGEFTNKITTNFINQFDVIPRIGEGISLEYIRKITEKSIDDSMKKVWGLKKVDAIFNLNIQEKITNQLFERDDVKNIDKIQKEIYGPCGKYYLLMNKYKPTEVINYGKKKSVFVRQLHSLCLFMPHSKKILSLLPKRSGLFANHMLFDHYMNNYLTSIYFMDK